MADWRNRIVERKRMRVGDLAINRYNPKQHPRVQQERLQAVLDKFGIVGDLVAYHSERNAGKLTLFDGHARQGLDPNAEWEVGITDLIDAEVDELVLYFDPLAALARQEADRTAALMADLDVQERALREMLEEQAQELGFKFGGNGKEEQSPPEPEIDRAQALQDIWQVEQGQIWEIPSRSVPGKAHRVMCGDSTEEGQVDQLVNGELVRMIFTDPPYGIGKDIANDNLKKGDWTEFYRQWTEVALRHLIENGYVYVWGYFETLSDYWQEVIKPRGDCNFRNFIIWQKTFIQGQKVPEFRQFPEHYAACLLFIYGQPFQNGPWSTSPNADYYWEGYEPIRSYLDGERRKMGWDIPTVKKMVGHSDMFRDHWFSKSQWSFPTREVYETLQREARSDAFRKEYDAFRKEYDDLRKEYDDLRGWFDNSNGFTDLWKLDRLTTTSLHPTVKPVEVCEQGIVTTSQVGETVLDVFIGSGSTVLACEQTGRIGYGMDIEAKFISVTLQRLQDLGLDPRLVE